MVFADMHTHILPKIDDGAKSTETALEMLDSLFADGVTDVVLTPHFYFHNQDMERFLNNRNTAFKKLSGALSRGINLHLGAETEFSNISIDYSLFSQLSIDNGGYIMLELPFKDDYAKSILPRLERFIYHTGMTPIIAHAERYHSIKKQPFLVSELIGIGCLIQVNTASVIFGRANDLTDALFKRGQAHLIGTDCHNMSARRPDYKKALEIIKSRYGDGYIERLSEISDGVLNNQRLEISTETKITGLFGRYR